MALKGNQNAKGNKGGGRKNASVEKADGELLMKVFFEPQAKDKLQKEIDSGIYSISSKMILDALNGKEAFIKEIFKKVFPDNINVNLQNTKILFELEAKTAKILGSLNKNGKKTTSNTKPSGE